MEWETVMGLEVHVELATESKLFCSCSAKFGAKANENVCPACCGMPGMLPVANKRAVELGMIAGKVTDSAVTREITFDKKNYFYPDLPTGYQITQWFAPICKNGRVEIETAQGKKTVTLKQIHLEEDAGKLSHDARLGVSLVDYNRAGVPLAEIVSNPDFRSAEEVIAYLTKLQKLLSFAGVSDCKMQEGSMRCDVNISVRKKGESAYGVRTEIKNMNSFRAIERAIAYESRRHIDALELKTEVLVQETRGWDDNAGETFAMRSKEDAHDYRYFPNPDIAPIVIDEAWLDAVFTSVPESAASKFARFTGEFGLPVKDCEVLTSGKHIAEAFEGAIANGASPKDAAAWVLGELLSLLKTERLEPEGLSLDVKKFAEIIALVKAGKLNRNAAKTVLQVLLKDVVMDVGAYLTENNLYISMESSELDGIIDGILADNPRPVAEFKGGNEKIITFFMGQIMKKTAGKADFKTVNAILLKKLGSLSE